MLRLGLPTLALFLAFGLMFAKQSIGDIGIEPITATHASVKKSSLYVLAIGTEPRSYSHQTALSAKDAEDVANVLRMQTGKLYEYVVVRLLISDKATRAAMIDAFDWIAQETHPDDVSIIFLSGIGIKSERGTFYFLSFDSNIEDLRNTAIPSSEIEQTLSSLSGKTILFVDTGFAASAARLAELRKAIFFAASNDLSLVVNGTTGNGAFTKALVEGLSGKADVSGDREISVSELDVYLARRVKDITKGRQIPVSAKPLMEDFPIVVTPN
jgi:hypothetical protein